MQRPPSLHSTISAVLFAAVFSIGAFSFAGIAKAAGEPVVTTGDTQGVTDTFAQMGFYINDSGTSDITEYGVKYATDAYYTANGNTYDQTRSAHTSVVSTTGGYFYVYSLACGTTYHFSAFATNGSGTGIGEDATFTTNACPAASPSITLNSPSSGSTITSWAPSVTWENAVTCSYSYDDATFTGTDCSANGSDIPAPAAGTVNLYLRAISSDDLEGDLWTTFTYDPPPVAGWNIQPSQESPSDISIAVDTYVNDAASNPVSYTIEYSLNGGSTWSNANHLSGTGLTISGATISGVTTHGNGVENRSQVAFSWAYTADSSTASTTNAKIRVTPHDANGDGNPIVSDPFALRAPPAPPVFADDSGTVTDITENSVIVHYDMSSTGSAQLNHFELHYADDAYYTVHSDYAQHVPVTYNGAFADTGATDATGLTCGTTYHFVQSFTNADGLTATSSDATFVTSDCTGGDGGGGGGGAPFTEGDGSSGSPFILNDCAQIPTINDDPSASYLLVANLDCRELGDNAIIGSGGGGFSGTFDGGGHSLTVDIESSTIGVGLFSILYGATVENLAIAPDSLVFGNGGTGSIAGLAVNSTITNVSSWATVISYGASPGYPPTGTGGLVGGLYGGTLDGGEFWGVVGAPYAVGGIAGIVISDLSDGPGGIVSRSDSKGQVLGGALVGGITGYAVEGSQIRNSYSSGTVSYYPDFATDLPVTGGFGGIAGALQEGIISRSYASGDVTGGTADDEYPTGGLVGFVLSADAVIVHSFAAGEVTSAGAPTGGFLGGADEGEMFAGLYDDYYDTVRTGQETCIPSDSTPHDGCEGVDGSATGHWLGTSDTPLPAWNRTDVWDVSAGEFPELRAVSGPLPDESDEFVSGGDGGDSEDTGNQDTPVPSHRSYRSVTSRSSIFARIEKLSKTGNADKLKEYLVENTARLKRYEEEGQTLPPEAVAFLGAGIVPPPASVPAGMPLRDLENGITGSDVSALQALLIKESTGTAAAMLASAGATGYFGPLTRAALSEYQVSNGIVPAVGYFGPVTRAKMKAVGLAGVWW